MPPRNERCQFCGCEVPWGYRLRISWVDTDAPGMAEETKTHELGICCMPCAPLEAKRAADSRDRVAHAGYQLVTHDEKYVLLQGVCKGVDMQRVFSLGKVVVR